MSQLFVALSLFTGLSIERMSGMSSANTELKSYSSTLMENRLKQSLKKSKIASAANKLKRSKAIESKKGKEDKSGDKADKKGIAKPGETESKGKDKEAASGGKSDDESAKKDNSKTTGADEDKPDNKVAAKNGNKSSLKDNEKSGKKGKDGTDEKSKPTKKTDEVADAEAPGKLKGGSDKKTPEKKLKPEESSLFSHNLLTGKYSASGSSLMNDSSMDDTADAKLKEENDDVAESE